MLSFKEALMQCSGYDAITQETETFGDFFYIWFNSSQKREDFMEVYNFLLEQDKGEVFDIFRNAADMQLDRIDLGDNVPVYRYGIIWEWRTPHEVKDLWDRLHWLMYDRLPKTLKP